VLRLAAAHLYDKKRVSGKDNLIFAQ